MGFPLAGRGYSFGREWVAPPRKQPVRKSDTSTRKNPRPPEREIFQTRVGFSISLLQPATNCCGEKSDAAISDSHTEGLTTKVRLGYPAGAKDGEYRGKATRSADAEVSAPGDRHFSAPHVRS